MKVGHIFVTCIAILTGLSAYGQAFKLQKSGFYLRVCKFLTSGFAEV